jgi:DNA-directed RNA polymerase specialized sigma24 family protein
MESSNPKAIELTEDLIDYIEAITAKVASKAIPKHIDLADVKQHVLLQIVNSPPKFDPTKNASVKTLLYVVVQRQVWKYVTSLERLGHEPSFDADLHGTAYRDAEPRFDQPSFMDYIVDEEIRRMCFLMMEHDANVSEVARSMDVTEGTIRHRLKSLRGKLRAAGFDPFAEVK